MAKSSFFLGVFLWLFTCLGLTGHRFPVNQTQYPDSNTISNCTPQVYPPDTTESILTQTVSIRDGLMATFRSQIGVTQTGNNTGPEVDMYLRSVGIEPPAFWCAAFLGWGFLENNLSIPQGAAWSPSWFPASRVIDNEKAMEADVGGIYFRNLGRIAHVFVYDNQPDRNSNFKNTIEGNANNDGGRNGHSVLRKKRNINQIYKTANWIDK